MEGPPGEGGGGGGIVVGVMSAWGRGRAPLRVGDRVGGVGGGPARGVWGDRGFSRRGPRGGWAAAMMGAGGVGGWGGGGGMAAALVSRGGPEERAVGGGGGGAADEGGLLSRGDNNIVVGGARGASFASYTLLFVRQPDHTAPRAGLYSAGRGMSVAAVRVGPARGAFPWWGHDRRLQKYSSGLRGFVVQQKTAHGWKTLRRMTKTRQLTLNLSKGTYQFRVKAVDRRGNRGIWRKPLTVTVR